MNVADNQKLSPMKKLLYGVGDIGNAVVNSAIQFFLMIFYTDAALVPPSLAANALLIGKAWDAVNDPLFGWFSDRTRSRFGKRRVYMIFGAIPLAVSIMLLWFVPYGMAQFWIFVWIAFTFVFFDTCWTLTNVPYYALTAELTDDYDERASLTAYRMVLAVPAYIVGAALTPALAGLFADKRSGFAAVGIAYGILAAVVLWIAAAGLKERPHISENKAQTSIRASFLATFKNRPFLQLIIAYMLASISFAFVKTLMAYFLIYYLDMESQVPVIMFLMLASVAIFLFPWKYISEKFDKGPAYAIGLLIGGLAVAATFLLPNTSTPWIYVIAAVAGFGFSAQWVFPWAMVPDVVDYDRLETGEHHGGMYYGVWGLVTKFSEALGIAGSGWLLAFYGYMPNVAQSDYTLSGIRLFFGPIPLIFFLIAFPLLLWFPVTRKKHLELRKKLEAQP